MKSRYSGLGMPPLVLAGLNGKPLPILFNALLLLLVPALDGMADEEITQYRYRSFEGSDPPVWVSTYVANQTALPPITKVERGAANDAFQEFWYANFDGSKRYVCNDDVPGNDLSADFSVIAWLNLNTTNGTQTICSTLDAANETGFRLYLNGGRLTGEAWFNTTSGGKTNLAIEYPAPIQTGIWHRLAFRRVKDSTTHFMDLWLDSTQVASNTILLSTDIDNSTLNPAFGADRAGSGYANYLNAKVYGIQVDDYGLSDFFLSSPVIRDGSRYFGTPSYHDYIGEDDTPLERRIHQTHNNPDLFEFRNRLVDRWFFPFANDDFIPQGVTSDQANHRLFISMYYKDANGENPGTDGDPCTSADDFPSIVAEILMPEGRLGNVFVLKDTDGSPMDSHVGGIAYLDGLLIVPKATNLLLYDIAGVPPSTFNPATLTGFNPLEIRPTKVLTNLVPWDSIAFIDLHQDESHQRWLLLGDYQLSESYTNYLFELTYSRGSTLTFQLSLSNRMFQSTHNMQGAATYFDVGSVMRSFQAGTGGRESRIVTALYPDKNAQPIANPTTIHSTIHVPRGLEQLSLYGDKLWSISESGSRHIQKRTCGFFPCNEKEDTPCPWAECYPFLYSLSVDDRLNTNSNRFPDQWEATQGLTPAADPDLDLDGDGFTLWEEFVADTNPWHGSDYPRISITRLPSEQVSFHTSSLRFYTLQTSSDLRSWTDATAPRFQGTDTTTTLIQTFTGPRRFYRLQVEHR